MAETTPFLGGFNTPSPNSAVIPVNQEVVDDYYRNAELQYRNKLLNYNQKQKQIEDAAAAVNFDTKGMLPADEGAIRKGIFDLIDYVDKYPDAASPNSNKYPEYKKMYEDINFGIHKSQQDYVRYVGNLDGISKGTFDPSHKEELDQWSQPTKDLSEIHDRQPLNLIPTPDNNIMTLAASVEKALTTGTKASTTAHKDQFGQIVNDTTTEQQIDLSRLPQAAKTIYDTDRSWRAQADQTFSALTPQQKQQYGNDPSNVLMDLLLPHINAAKNEKQSFRTDWFSQFAAQQAAKGANDAWIVDFGRNLFTANSPAYTDANGNVQTKTINGVEFDFAPAQADMYVKAPTKLFTTSDGTPTSVTNVGGFLRDKSTGKLYASPSGDPDKLFPIENYHTQVITPSLDTKYKGTAYNFNQDVQNYAPSGDPNDFLKIPKKQTENGAQPNTGQGNQQPKAQERKKITIGNATYDVLDLNEANPVLHIGSRYYVDGKIREWDGKKLKLVQQ